jgi:hypothetical protein
VSGLPQRKWYVHRPAVGPEHPVAEAFVEYARSPAARQALLAARPRLSNDTHAEARR